MIRVDAALLFVHCVEYAMDSSNLSVYGLSFGEIFLSYFLEGFTPNFFPLLSLHNSYYLDVGILELILFLKKYFSLSSLCLLLYFLGDFFQFYPPALIEFFISVITFLISKAIIVSVPFLRYSSLAL